MGPVKHIRSSDVSMQTYTGEPDIVRSIVRFVSLIVLYYQLV